MTQRNGTRRYDVMFALLAVVLLGLLWRLARLLEADDGTAGRMAWRQHRLVLKLPGRPGNIFARARHRYVLLAGSKQVPFCYADPGIVEDDGRLEALAAKVAPAIGLTPGEVLGLLLARRDERFVILKHDLSEQEIQAVEALRLRAVGVDYEWRRDYPNGALAATVVGYRRRDGQAGAGLEQAWDRKHLAAADGQRVVLADASRRAIWPVPRECTPPRDGRHVFLSIDTGIQSFLEEAVGASVEKFRAQWGVGIVVDPRSGQILAMCSVPSFNPNEYTRYPQDLVTNKALCVPYEPGSALKPIFAAAAVDAGVMTYDTRIFCENGLYVTSRGGQITDHGASYGTMPLTDVVVYSSNIGMAKVGEALGNPAMYAVAQRFGFGHPTGVELPGESGGILRDLAKWDGYSTRRVPFGQEISLTSLQLTMAFAAISNGGWLLRPRVVDCVRDAHGRMVWGSQKQVVRRVLSEAAAQQSLAVLREVVLRGTGKACRMEQWSSFGKTGTGQIAQHGKYVDGAFVGSFVGGAPAGRPEVLCLISIYWPDESLGHYGSTVAAPYVRQVLERTLAYLNVPPDQPAERSSVAAGQAVSGRLLAQGAGQD
ncbi:MAG: penicillin-binding protein 2 [Phycisphaerae bacterium]|nr:penicillin-binding protein 2 [Phycisphaerae bacterium]